MGSYKPIGRAEVEKMRRELNALLERVEKEAELEVQSDLARYACMRLTGFMERALLIVGRSLVAQTSGGASRLFGESHLQRAFNPERDRVVSFVRRFNPVWAAELEAHLDESERGSTLNALVGVRNQIAHGQSTGVGLARVCEYKAVVDSVIEFLLDRAEPARRAR